MNFLVMLFLGAIYAGVIMIYIKLDSIEFEVKNGKRKSNRSCSTCIYSEMHVYDEPCDRCLSDPDKSFWKGLDE